MIHKFALVLLFFLLTGCSAFVSQDQIFSAEAMPVTLQQSETVGQTFVAHHAGLTGMDIFLTPETPSNGVIHLYLRSDASSSTDLAMDSIPLETITDAQFYHFSFAPQPDSRQQDYYVVLQVEGQGRVHVGNAPGETYLDGTLYHNHQPVDVQMAFRLTFDRAQMWRGFAGQVVVWGWMVVVGFALYILPGLALLTLVWPGTRVLTWAEKLGLSAGLSIALYPLLFLWTDLVGIHAGMLYVWVPLVAAGAALVWHYRHIRPTDVVQSWHNWLRSDSLWHDLALVAVVALIFAVRFMVIGSLDIPMWGDSYHHTMIAQLLVDHGGLFDSWLPYAELKTFTYHFGFHVAVAQLHWLTGWALPKATLWTGQILNGLAVVALYPLAARIGGNRWAGIAALVIAGLLVPMPMYYVNWGRYTQLAGQVILPVAVYLAWHCLDMSGPDRRSLIVAWVALSGLCLTHYRVTVMLALFFVVFFLLNIRSGRVGILLRNGILLAIGAGILFLPWFVHVFAGKIADILFKEVAYNVQQSSGAAKVSYAIGDIAIYLPPLIWGLLPFSIGWALWRRERGVAVVAVWWFVAFILANGQWFYSRNVGGISNFALDNFAVFIAAYIPAGLCLGACVGWLVGRLRHKHMLAISMVLIVGIAAWGGSKRLGDMQVAQGALVTSPDEKAMDWIQAHTPPESRFVVNAFFAYNGAVIVGSDGGWWMPLLAKRQTNLPPITYAFEQSTYPGYKKEANAFWEEMQAKGIQHPDVVRMLQEHGMTHVYIGQRQGQVNNAGFRLDPHALLASEHFQVVYHQDRVWVFEIVPLHGSGAGLIE